MNQDLNEENLINGGSEKEGGVLKKNKKIICAKLNKEVSE